MTWSARPVPGVEGVWHLLRDGEAVGGVSFLPEAGWRVGLLVEDVVAGLNSPVPIEGRQFGGRAGDMLAARRAQRAGHPSAT